MLAGRWPDALQSRGQPRGKPRKENVNATSTSRRLLCPPQQRSVLIGGGHDRSSFRFWRSLCFWLKRHSKEIEMKALPKPVRLPRGQATNPKAAPMKPQGPPQGPAAAPSISAMARSLRPAAEDTHEDLVGLYENQLQLGKMMVAISSEITKSK